MRVKSEIWVKAYLRRVQGAGAFCVVVRRGNDEAGAIYVKQVPLDGTARGFSPGPAGFDAVARDRHWICQFGDVSISEEQADAYLAQQAGYDPDIWVIEVEDRDGRHFMDEWLAQP